MAQRRFLASERAAVSTIAVCVVLMTLCFILGTPRNGGPDEPSHAVASAALVRGQRPLVFSADVTLARVYQLPGNIGRPDPGCFALQPTAPAGCIDSVVVDPTEGPALSRAGWYPIWGHITPGLASLIPWPAGYPYLARLLGAVVPVALLIGSLLTLTRHREFGAIAALVGFTPIAWFSLGVVNPSSLAITGGLAMWVGLLVVDWRTARRDVSIGWLAVLGFVALELTRRDGALWATVLVTAVCVGRGVPPSRLWVALSRRARVVVLVTVVLQALGKVKSQAAEADLLLALAPLGVVVIELLFHARNAALARFSRRAVVGVGIAFGVGVAGLGLVVLDQIRAGGLRLDTVRIVVSATGSHLRQLVGLMGWLDAPTPDLAVFMWWALIGMMVTVAMLQGARIASTAMMVLGSVVVLAWVLEVGASLTADAMWQGRYSMPVVVGVPLLLAVPWVAGAPPRRIVVTLAAGMWVVDNLAFLNTQRRWAVGIEGSLLPWEWNTWNAPVPPPLLVLVHLLASAALFAACLTRLDRAGSAPAAEVAPG